MFRPSKVHRWATLSTGQSPESTRVDRLRSWLIFNLSRMKHRSRYLAGLLIGAAVNCCCADSCVRYNEDGVVLTGKVERRTFYGPPNYGENPRTDSRETQAILRLDRPLCTAGSVDGLEQAEDAQELVTLVPLGPFSLKPFAGKRVSVKGSLFHAHTGHHRTPILIELRQPPALKR